MARATPWRGRCRSTTRRRRSHALSHAEGRAVRAGRRTARRGKTLRGRHQRMPNDYERRWAGRDLTASEERLAATDKAWSCSAAVARADRRVREGRDPSVWCSTRRRRWCASSRQLPRGPGRDRSPSLRIQCRSPCGTRSWAGSSRRPSRFPLAMGYGMFAFVALGDAYFAHGVLAGCIRGVVALVSVATATDDERSTRRESSPRSSRFVATS